MVTRLVVVEDPPEVLAADWLTSTDDKVLACRGQGHAWPKIRAGRVPKGISATRCHDGSYQLVFVCRDCGTERELTTLPGGVLDLPAQYRYRYPAGFASPKGSGVTRRDCLAESWRRAVEQITSRTEVMPSA